ncbi:WD40 repeat-like protein [Wallemia mellicola CBS 633.66]|uniref:WD40 repeat-like protein n=1 Tax=Wallemia mellicola (strain ATCC MYA-4683 / CBS 633.66) TaxID=671144 RepID=I4YEI8_WALMC|nr:WD40 repeat-like protein [Wallemia mellicola CBS 633.66]EIM22380.1 WD40 repeat-like protein [Wallemia mellicola CBS 633.66]|eukprot:XP_006957630.1 WD40 repeat-like protein [Wallemia mellicola CBS 633.66]
MKNKNVIKTTKKLKIYNLNLSKNYFLLSYNNNLAIINSQPLETLLSVDLNGKLSNSRLFNNTNCLLLIGNQHDSAFSPNKLVLYDVTTQLVISTIEFNQFISNIETSGEFVIISIDNTIFLFRLSNNYSIERLFSSSCHSNSPLAINFYNNRLITLAAGNKFGHLQLITHSINLTSTKFIQAHSSKLSALALSSDNSLFATSSVTGTVVRIWDTNSCKAIHQLRRGSDLAKIFSSSIAFSPDSIHFALISDKGTIHLWDLTKQPTSSYSYLSHKYFTPKRSNAQFHLPLLDRHAKHSPFVTSSQNYAQFDDFEESFNLSWESNNVIVIASTFGRLFRLSIPTNVDDNQLQLLDFRSFSKLL